MEDCLGKELVETMRVLRVSFGVVVEMPGMVWKGQRLLEVEDLVFAVGE